MGVLAHHALLGDQHFYKARAMLVLLERLKELFLLLRHRASDAMTIPFELADIDAGAGRFAHCHGLYLVRISLPVRVIRV